MQQLINIIEEVKEKITDGSDMLWTTYETPGELRAELEKYAGELKAGNKNCLYQLHILFLPTSDLQEHSLMNGWSEIYLRLADAFDNIYAAFSKNGGT